MLVADEPTRHLDAGNLERILTLLQRLSGDFGKTLVIATRDPRVAVRANARFHVEQGALSRREPRNVQGFEHGARAATRAVS